MAMRKGKAQEGFGRAVFGRCEIVNGQVPTSVKLSEIKQDARSQAEKTARPMVGDQ